MKRLLPLLPFLLPGLAARAPAQDAAPAKKPEPPQYTFLWKVEREGLATNYLFGTIHVPDDRVNTLHPDVRAALNQADAFYAELELGDTTEMQQELLAAAKLPEGQTLKDLLPADLYQEAKRAVGGDLAMRAVNGYKPFMIELQIMQQELVPDILMGKEPLDIRLYKVAQSKGMEVGGVEQVGEQVQALANTLSLSEQVENLRESVKKYFAAKERGTSDLQRILQAWLSGSSAWLLAIGNQDWDPAIERDRKLREALLLRRNRNMAERIAKLMRDHPAKKYVFAFGTFHFIGEGSVVELLRKDGFTVTRLLAPPPELEARLIEQDESLHPAEEAVGAGGR